MTVKATAGVEGVAFNLSDGVVNVGLLDSDEAATVDALDGVANVDPSDESATVDASDSDEEATGDASDGVANVDPSDESVEIGSTPSTSPWEIFCFFDGLLRPPPQIRMTGTPNARFPSDGASVAYASVAYSSYPSGGTSLTQVLTRGRFPRVACV